MIMLFIIIPFTHFSHMKIVSRAKIASILHICMKSLKVSEENSVLSCIIVHAVFRFREEAEL